MAKGGSKQIGMKKDETPPSKIRTLSKNHVMAEVRPQNKTTGLFGNFPKKGTGGGEGGSKALWKFSENSSVLAETGFP